VFFRKTNDACPSLARTLADAVRVWWRQDDIRASPTEGRLLRIEVPSIVEMEGELFEMTRRVVGQRSDGMYVAYDGRAAAGGTECEFECRPGSRTVRWRDVHGEREIDSQAIGVFCPKRHPTHEVTDTCLR
jgi:hypothetical protein